MYFWSVSLVYQLSGQFPIFWSTKKNVGIPKKNLVYQKEIWSTKKKLVDQKQEKMVFGRPKKCEIDRTIGQPKRLTKSTWTLLMCYFGIVTYGIVFLKNFFDESFDELF